MRYSLIALSAFACVSCFDYKWDNDAFLNGGKNIRAVNIYGVGGRDHSKKVTYINSESGECKKEDFEFEGPLGVLGDEISVHFRGPGTMKQLAAYYPCGSSGGDSGRKYLDRRHTHQQWHKRYENHHKHEAGSKKGDDEWVTATIDGVVQSWRKSDEQPPPSPNAEPLTHVESTVDDSSVDDSSVDENSKKEKPPGSAKVASSSSSEDWCRESYYNSEAGDAEGLVFLGNYGGQGSGEFTYSLGNSLSYLDKKGISGGSTSQILDDVQLGSNKEYVVMTDKECKDGSCGKYRPGTVAYHGWGGPAKAFFFEFSMPLDGTHGFNADMPALWLLNANIPRTLQYGNAECNCWPECGELDIFEILASGSEKARITYHGPNGKSRGCEDWMQRPVDGTIKLAVIMQDGTVSIEIVDEGVEFGEIIPKDVAAEVQKPGTPENAYTEFFVGGAS